LGQYFRRRYHKLLGDKYSPNKVYVHSVDLDRCLMSAEANLAGLFPPNDEEKWHKDIAWQPVPIHTKPMNSDFTLVYQRDCPRYFAAIRKYQKESPEVQQILERHNDLILYWSEKCGSKLTSIDDLFSLYGVFLLSSLHNKTYVMTD
jgi:lysosomal acid phosphatase